MIRELSVSSNTYYFLLIKFVTFCRKKIKKLKKDKLIFMKWIKILYFFTLLCSFSAYAIFYEVDGEFGYSKKVYGADRQNSLTDRSYSSSIAAYLFEATAFELNFYSGEEINTVNDEFQLSNGISTTGSQVKVNTDVFGAGLRQSFAPRNAAIRPLLSLGYAKQFVKSKSSITYKLDSTGETILVEDPVVKNRYDSVFASFMLQIRLTQFISVKGSVRTVFPAFVFNKAKDNINYMAGLTFVF